MSTLRGHCTEATLTFSIMKFLKNYICIYIYMLEPSKILFAKCYNNLLNISRFNLKTFTFQSTKYSGKVLSYIPYFMLVYKKVFYNLLNKSIVDCCRKAGQEIWTKISTAQSLCVQCPLAIFSIASSMQFDKYLRHSQYMTENYFSYSYQANRKYCS